MISTRLPKKIILHLSAVRFLSLVLSTLQNSPICVLLGSDPGVGAAGGWVQVGLMIHNVHVKND